MDDTFVEKLEDAGFVAEIYSSSLPGEFRVVYRDASGRELEETPLTGISSYKQREDEIREKLRAFREGMKPATTPDQGDPGEY